MSTFADFRLVLFKAEFLLLERSERESLGPTLRIVHRFRMGKLGCQPGEEVFQVVLLHQGHEFVVPLALALRLLVNYLADHRRAPQSATQIAAGIRISPFYTEHGRNSGNLTQRKVSRTAVKEYIKRIRMALEASSREAGLDLDPAKILVSRRSTGNEVLYQLRAAIEWLHSDELSATRPVLMEPTIRKVHRPRSPPTLARQTFRRTQHCFPGYLLMLGGQVIRIMLPHALKAPFARVHCMVSPASISQIISAIADQKSSVDHWD